MGRMPAVDQAPLPEPCECGQTHAVAPPPRTLPVTPAERFLAAILRSFQAWNTHSDAGMPDDDAAAVSLMLDLGEWLQERGMLNEDEPGFTPAVAALLARVEAAERTPETVLRAMLVSYEADAIEKARAYYADPGVDASLLRATNEADTDVEIVRDQLAILLAKGFTTFTVSMSTIGADYAARLAGTTPIDAPPAKEPR